jgi:hypothetical protein
MKVDHLVSAPRKLAAQLHLKGMPYVVVNRDANLSSWRDRPSQGRLRDRVDAKLAPHAACKGIQKESSAAARRVEEAHAALWRAAGEE